MRRRDFLAILGGASAGWSISARAQQTVPVIGYVSGRSLEYEERLLASFRKGLEDEGYSPGRNVAIQYRFSDGDDSRLPAIAADFVRREVSVIIASGPSAAVVKGATSTIPIVFSTGFDPIGQGLVASLGRPGGNATGVSIFTNELGPKRLELLQELVPKAELIAFVANLHSTGTAAQIDGVQAAAAAFGQKLLVLVASTPEEVEKAFATIAQEKAGAVFIARTNSIKLSAISLWRSPRGSGCRRCTNGRVRRSGRTRQLQYQPQPHVPPNGSLHRPNSQRCKTLRTAGRAIDQVRTRDQPQDRQGSRSRPTSRALARADEVIE